MPATAPADLGTVMDHTLGTFVPGMLAPYLRVHEQALFSASATGGEHGGHGHAHDAMIWQRLWNDERIMVSISTCLCRIDVGTVLKTSFTNWNMTETMGDGRCPCGDCYRLYDMSPMFRSHWGVHPWRLERMLAELSADILHNGGFALISNPLMQSPFWRDLLLRFLVTQLQETAWTSIDRFGHPYNIITHTSADRRLLSADLFRSIQTSADNAE